LAQFPSSLTAARLAAVPNGVSFFFAGTHSKTYIKIIFYKQKLLDKNKEKRNNLRV
jgi:hypothetical protein